MWAAIGAGVFGIIGVAVGQWLGRRRSDRDWQRDQQLRAYVDAVTSISEHMTTAVRFANQPSDENYWAFDSSINAVMAENVIVQETHREPVAVMAAMRVSAAVLGARQRERTCEVRGRDLRPVTRGTGPPILLTRAGEEAIMQEVEASSVTQQSRRPPVPSLRGLVAESAMRVAPDVFGAVPVAGEIVDTYIDCDALIVEMELVLEPGRDYMRVARLLEAEVAAAIARPEQAVCCRVRWTNGNRSASGLGRSAADRTRAPSDVTSGCPA